MVTTIGDFINFIDYLIYEDDVMFDNITITIAD